ncbi:MAG: hypothetical protein ACK479_15825 [Fluviicola sp.]
MLKQSYRIILFILITFSLNSCSLLVAILTPTPTEEIVRNLDLKYSDYKGLLGNTNISGPIENNNYATVYDVTIKATITSPSGRISTQEIEINAGIPSNSHIEFVEKISTYKDDNVKLQISYARF